MKGTSYARAGRGRRSNARNVRRSFAGQGQSRRLPGSTSVSAFAGVALGVLEQDTDLVLLVSDNAGRVLWRTGGCGRFEDALGPGGVLAPQRLAARVPGTGSATLRDGREVRWIARCAKPGLPGVGCARWHAPMVLWTLQDATGETRRQRALEDAEGRLRLLSAHLRGIIFELDSQVRFVRVWTSDPRLLARPESELLGHTVLEALGPELGRRHHEAALATVESGESARYEYELDVPSGHRHFACESVAVSGVDAGERHAVFWIRDITEQVQLQRRLVESERLAAVGVLAAGVAHEINNPLAYMMLNAEQLLTHLGRLAPESSCDQRWGSLQDCARMIHEGAQRVQRIVGDLLQLAKPAGPPELIDLRQIVVLSLELTRTFWESRARVTTEWEDAPRVLGHPGGLVQVFTNLLTNSAEAIEVGTPHDNEIAIAVRRAGRSAVQVEFRDTGVGIPREDAERVFEPFFTTKEHGTGLGLAICQTIVHSFNGEIRLERGQPRGSVFRVLLPAADQTEQED